MTATQTVERLAKHVRAEQKAFVGYPYDGRTAEREWTLANLPQDQDAFCSVAKAVQADWAGASNLNVAELLLGISSYVPDGCDTIMLRRVPEDCLSIVRTWGVPIDNEPQTWPVAKPRHACIECGEPAISRASLGWACEQHYNKLS